MKEYYIVFNEDDMESEFFRTIEELELYVRNWVKDVCYDDYGNDKRKMNLQKLKKLIGLEVHRLDSESEVNFPYMRWYEEAKKKFKENEKEEREREIAQMKYYMRKYKDNLPQILKGI